MLPRGGGRLRGRSNSSQGKGGARVTGAATGKAWDEETLLPGLDVNLIAELTRDDLYICNLLYTVLCTIQQFIKYNKYKCNCRNSASCLLS